ncbi:AlpA family transcriptional regulator [Mesorhizobium sp.]|uniref:helix-turn-helix transcriptional regulator n=1 Tax=Mesorhizobium sp. TaxID=1871066 RepID=UPI0025B95BAE|nr:AlpA family transcriptional regulator [Mesorhizobium sp.]
MAGNLRVREMNDSAIVLSIPQVCASLGISRATLDRYIKDNPTFPKKKKLGPRLVGFLRSDVETYIRSLPDA